MSEKRPRTDTVGRRQNDGLTYLAEVDVPEASAGNLYEWRVRVPAKILGNLIEFGVESSHEDAGRKALDALKGIED